MQAHQAGFANVVAQLGTALTEGNMRRLTRNTQRIILALDPDTAGKAATMRGLDVAREALEPEWEPVFDARGLIHLEGRLSADIRVMTLPSGQDPDDLIRSDPARWAVLVDGAIPLVEHYMQTLMEGKDLADPKVKADVTEDLVPVIRQVSSPVERAHYAQELARILKVDERPLLDMVASTPRGRRPRRRAPEETPERTQRKGVDLEAYCLAGLLHMTDLLAEADTELAEIGLNPVSVDDFSDPELREVFRAWRELVNAGNIPSRERLAAALPTQLHARMDALFDASSLTLQNEKWLLEAQVQPGQDIFDLRPDEIRIDLTQSLLKLRERYLLRQNTALRFLLQESDPTDVRHYRQATSETILALSRLQRKMSARISAQQPLAGSPDQMM